MNKIIKNKHKNKIKILHHQENEYKRDGSVDKESTNRKIKYACDQKTK